MHAGGRRLMAKVHSPHVSLLSSEPLERPIHKRSQRPLLVEAETLSTGYVVKVGA